MFRKPMTIGQLARRTGVPIKTFREYEQLGLLYTLGPSERNYRLFDEEPLWCVHLIRTLRSLGLTLKDLQELGAFYVQRPSEPFGPQLNVKLAETLNRIEARIADLQALRQRIHAFQAAHARELGGETQLDLVVADPRRTPASSAS